MLSAVLLQCAQLEEDLRVLRQEVLRSGDVGVQLPVNFRRLIWNAQQMFHCQPHRPGASGSTAEHPQHIWSLLPVSQNESLANRACHSPLHVFCWCWAGYRS